MRQADETGREIGVALATPPNTPRPLRGEDRGEAFFRPHGLRVMERAPSKRCSPEWADLPDVEVDCTHDWQRRRNEPGCAG